MSVFAVFLTKLEITHSCGNCHFLVVSTHASTPNQKFLRFLCMLVIDDIGKMQIKRIWHKQPIYNFQSSHFCLFFSVEF